ncbi:MAG: STAS domain-containing protein [Candidatus Abyssubacteria bacterium]
MEIDARREGDATVIRVSGDVDLDTSPKLRKALIDAVNKKHSPIVVDLSDVTYIDSSGVATLVESLQLSSKYGGTFRLVGLNDHVSEVFKLARLQRVFMIYDSVDEALGG